MGGDRIFELAWFNYITSLVTIYLNREDCGSLVSIGTVAHVGPAPIQVSQAGRQRVVIYDRNSFV
jgi:hypothetical protein